MNSTMKNNEILEKIHNVAQEMKQQELQRQQSRPSLHPSPLSPIQYPNLEGLELFSPSQPEILTMFDPLSQGEVKPHIPIHSPIPMASPTSPEVEYEAFEPSRSNSLDNSTSMFSQLVVKPRKEVSHKDLDEFVEHLRALYLSIKSKFALTSQGLIWSPRIDVEHIESGHVGSSDQYMISPGKKIRDNKKSLEHSNNDQTDFLLEVRYNSLIHSKLNGLPSPRTVPHIGNGLEEENNWYSIKIPATMQSVVEAIVLYIIHNVGKEPKNVSFS